jgi:hypothetical protein
MKHLKYFKVFENQETKVVRYEDAPRAGYIWVSKSVLDEIGLSEKIEFEGDEYDRSDKDGYFELYTHEAAEKIGLGKDPSEDTDSWLSATKYKNMEDFVKDFAKSIGATFEHIPYSEY